VKSKPLHDGTGTVVACLGERDDFVGIQLVERELQPGAPDLGGVAAAPEFVVERPPDLQTIPTIDVRSGQTAPPNSFAGHPVVGHPLVNTFHKPRLSDSGDLLIDLFARPFAVPLSYGRVSVYRKKVVRMPRTDRFQTETICHADGCLRHRSIAAPIARRATHLPPAGSVARVVTLGVWSVEAISCGSVEA
jgi:hypothetical protein